MQLCTIAHINVQPCTIALAKCAYCTILKVHTAQLQLWGLDERLGNVTSENTTSVPKPHISMSRGYPLARDIRMSAHIHGRPKVLMKPEFTLSTIPATTTTSNFLRHRSLLATHMATYSPPHTCDSTATGL